MRRVGDIYLDLEVLYEELIEDHEMQMGDMLYWLYGHLKIHNQCIEEYTDDGSNPIFKYGPKPDRKIVKKRLVELLKTWEGSKLDGETADQILNLIEREYL